MLGPKNSWKVLLHPYRVMTPQQMRLVDDQIFVVLFRLGLHKTSFYHFQSGEILDGW